MDSCPHTVRSLSANHCIMPTDLSGLAQNMSPTDVSAIAFWKNIIPLSGESGSKPFFLMLVKVFKNA